MATRYIGLKEMCELTGKSHPTLWRMWAKKKEFPAPQKSLSGSFLGWPENIYEEWVKSQNANSTR
ncbi:AlpA family phage regulatory protein [Erwinia sp. OLTSP20]|uniref:helix-turn-helix transcriptional regulator n=1 Tax=unclassified Erwinia TaxID=2622719 RepID=UPI000C1799E5|nr:MULTISPECIES: AlpA family phage regulatory protein [unclassified Erwinia]PIJ50644.1 AlpA family phage regulatory protein [Erwinia sp. OAMSP11]PIJ72690.1 AlpA family phage regulatory protein [Erwinia sp. OLSSP12]PIJ83228.1 AlpA family phage regulatory protein [Erwinia sp. OLCASP19]PIJ85271.1 AlpA family phage regulatory protein [Erwinia sp. OLMTSP26]PIJ87273.1 AlpA family phage regulatory protein [Erwinia sp. OLMDSP33]